MKMKTDAEADVNITSLIDCLMQCIIFFMVIMSAQYVFGVTIKFPSVGKGPAPKEQKVEKRILVEIQADYLDRAADGGHRVMQDGVIKLNGVAIPLVTTLNDSTKWAEERQRGFDYLGGQIRELIKQGYKQDVLMIRGDMKSYHWKTMMAIDKGVEAGMGGFSIMPPVR